MSASSPIQIRSAIDRDIPAIYRIADAHAIGSKEPTAAANDGFLVSAYTPEMYSLWQNHLDVVEQAGEIVGFTLTFLRSDVQADLEDLGSLLPHVSEPEFLLVKQVAVRRGLQGQGIGKTLYRNLLARFPTLPTFAAILLEPENPRSVAFHESMGFKRFLEFRGSDNARRCFWRHEAAG